MWVYAELTPSINMDKFKDFFKALVDEKGTFVASDFNEDWVDDENWCMVDNRNKKKGIYIPAVYPDKVISWRWR